jgi:hypothetical protein
MPSRYQTDHDNMLDVSIVVILHCRREAAVEADEGRVPRLRRGNFVLTANAHISGEMT